MQLVSSTLMTLAILAFSASPALADAAVPQPVPVADPPPAASVTAAPAEVPSEAAKKNAPAEDRDVYISFSPFHLLFPVVELTAEVRLHRKIGIAAIGGYGQITSGGSKFSVWEAGGQFVGYPIGHFDHGMQLGLEALYAGISGAESAGSARITATGNGLAMGPFVGYKLATKVGFSFNVQGGVEYLVASADARSSSASASASQSSFIPLLNINVGWSF